MTGLFLFLSQNGGKQNVPKQAHPDALVCFAQNGYFELYGKDAEKAAPLGKYNEGELVGEWVKFPTTEEEMQKVFERIGIGSKDEFGHVYAKLRTAEKDTQISLADLRRVCDQAVREEMEILIAADIAVSVEGAASVYTDTKLLVFILKQLLINCAKYCPGCQVRMELAQNSLRFEDNGPGIPAHELRRVTERGFTGTAGRAQGQSTGMGLYIVSELCKMLNIGLEIASEENRYTRFVLRFSARI